MVTVDLELLAVPNVDEWGAGITTAIENAMPAVAQALLESADSCFERQADPWGAAWTATRRSAAHEGRILIDHGILRGSLAPSPVVPEPGRMRATVAAGGAAAAYAGVHQWGYPEGGIVPRPFLALRGTPGAPDVDLPAATRAEVVGTIQDALDAYVATKNAERSTPER